MSPAAKTSRVPEVHVRKAADLFNSLLAQGDEALAPYRSPDYRAPCVCGDEVDKHTGPVKTGKCTGCGNCIRYRANMAHVRVHEALMGKHMKFRDLLRTQRREDYQKQPRDERKPGEWIVRFSDVGGCGRQIGYRNGLGGPVVEIAVPKYDGEALAGDVVEAAVRRVNSREFPWRQYQREVRHPAIPRPGKIDEWDPVLGMVIDTKSAGDWKWDHVTTAGTMLPNLQQVCLYALALELEGVQVNFVRVHYIHRDNFDESFEPHTYPWDDKRRAIAEQALVELAGRQGQLDIAEISGELPERDRTGSTSGLCRRCDFYEACWNVPQAEARGRTPESLTLLGDEPDEAEIENACRQIVAKRAAVDAAKKEYDAARRLVDNSLRLGDYGVAARLDKNSQGYRIKTSDYIEALCRKIELLGGDPMDVPIPRGGPGLPIAKIVGEEAQRKRAKARAAAADAEAAAAAEGGAA